MMTKVGYSVFQRVTTARLLRKICLLALTVPFLTSSAIGLATANEKEYEYEGEKRDIRYRTLGRYALLGSPSDNGSPEPNR